MVDTLLLEIPEPGCVETQEDAGCFAAQDVTLISGDYIAKAALVPMDQVFRLPQPPVTDSPSGHHAR